LQLEHRLDLTPRVSAIVAVFLRPYQDFVSQLRADGRITDAEIDELTNETKFRGEHLAELVREELGLEPE
jgi:hypothetical protein